MYWRTFLPKVAAAILLLSKPALSVTGEIRSGLFVVGEGPERLDDYFWQIVAILLRYEFVACAGNRE